ncbi:MAG: hypothetical protein AAGA54_22280 [Myxococcota bacterium]
MSTNGYWDVEVGGGLARIRRTDKRSDDMDAFLRSFDDIYAAVGEGRLAQTDLLIDLRRGLGRNDVEFEQRLAARRKELFMRFRRSALLVRTAVGQLQVRRHMEADGVEPAVFLDETEAVAWLRARA